MLFGACGDSLSTRVRNFPFGDQSTPQNCLPFAGDPNHEQLTSETCSLFSTPPAAGMVTTSTPAGVSRKKAMWRASGDHTGLYSDAGLLVSRRGVASLTS